MFGLYHDPRIGAGIGAVWIAGRILYLAGCMTDPSKRGPGFGIQALATLTPLVGSLVSAIERMV